MKKCRFAAMCTKKSLFVCMRKKLFLLLCVLTVAVFAAVYASKSRFAAIDLWLCMLTSCELIVCHTY